jgi:hypothetical protein
MRTVNNPDCLNLDLWDYRMKRIIELKNPDHPVILLIPVQTTGKAGREKLFFPTHYLPFPVHFLSSRRLTTSYVVYSIRHQFEEPMIKIATNEPGTPCVSPGCFLALLFSGGAAESKA